MRQFVREVFSDSGVASYSRVASGGIVLAVLGWVTWALLRNHGTIPPLEGPAWFLGTGVGAHYGAGKLPDIMSSIRKPPNCS